MISRVRVTCTGVLMPLRFRVRVILRAGRAAHVGYRIIQAQACRSERPLISTMMSPGLMPAREPGVSSIGVMTLSRPSALRDLKAEPAELAGGLHLHIGILLGVHVAGMRVQPGQHAVDGIIDQLVRRRVDDVILLHLGEDVPEQGELLIGAVIGRILAHGAVQRLGDRADGEPRQKNTAQHQPVTQPHAHHSLNRSPDVHRCYIR